MARATGRLFPKEAAPFYLPQHVRGLQFLRILAHAGTLHLFDSRRPSGGERASCCGFDLNFLWLIMVGIFSCVHTDLLSVLSGEMLIQILCSFQTWIPCFFIIEW